MNDTIKLKVKNYQIIQKAEAEFIHRTQHHSTVLVTIGKSSFIKALKALLYTESRYHSYS